MEEEKQYSPKRWTPLHDWKTKTKVKIGDLVFQPEIKVKDYYEMMYLQDIGDNEGLFVCLKNMGIPIESLNQETFEKLVSALFNEDRFNKTSSSGDKIFCMFQDFDLIYSSFAEKYPHKVSCPDDLANMDYYEFNMLLTGCMTSIKSRMQTRSQEIPKAPKGAKQEALSEHNKMVKKMKEAKESVKLTNSKILKYC